MEEIRFLNKIGFTLCEIKDLVGLTKSEMISVLEKKIIEIEDKREELNVYLKETREYIERLLLEA